MSTYLESDKGKFIPATKRPDGTWRKARRVKDGYVPQEEVPLYESKGKQFVAQRQTGVPPGMCPLVAAELKKAHEKKEKAKLIRIDRKAISTTGTATTTKPAQPTTTTKPVEVGGSAPKAINEREITALAKTLDAELTLTSDASEVDIAKQLKKLRKKIREIEQIESKMQTGNANKLDKDQLDKVKKKSDILKQLAKLEDIAKV
ncbi:hypothetical protein KR093_006445 [Drosophila rubida]|uniref:Partner of Y14 and mago n=1 Tax=Drosophila rubida TaxID=30044 RepID=A0AAD4K0V6_9MUSC|nr:hypothetical protein KR093_006445 [Drosophila rubida]